MRLSRKWIIGVFLLLGGCHIPANSNTEVSIIQEALNQSIAANQKIEDAHQTPPTNLLNETLLPSLSYQKSSEAETSSDRRFDISTNNVPARTFFMGLVEGTPYNMVVNPGVTGEVSLNLKDVTVDEAMEAVRDAYGYDYRRTTYGFEVLQQTVQTQIFTINYLNIQRSGYSQTQLASSQISDKVGSTSAGGGGSSTISNQQSGVSGTQSNSSGSLVNTRSETDFWKSLDSTLKGLVGEKDGRSVTVNPQAGIVLVKAFPSELRDVAKYLDRIQNSLQRQVVLEAKILEVQLNNTSQAGIDWSRLGYGRLGLQQFGDTSLGNLNFLTNSTRANGIQLAGASPTGMFSLSLSGKFTAVINLLKTQGNVQVLSSPRISTLNNQKAVIKVGEDEFFVTSITSNLSAAVVGSNTTQSQSVGLTPFFSGITLDVTPQISNRGEIVLHIHPSVSTVVDDSKKIDLGQNNGAQNVLILPLAKSTIRESDSIVYSKSGQIVAIGGLMQNQVTKDVEETPVLSKIPLLGGLFKNTNKTSKKMELVILLRASITNDKMWSNDMTQTNHRMQKLEHNPAGEN